MGSPKDEEGREDNEGLARGQWVKGEPRVEVSISRPFCMGVTEVTVAQYERFWKDSGREDRGVLLQKPRFNQGSDHPAVMVSWDDAQAFCEWLSKKTGRKVRLPTEAQWEYACRAGTQTAYSFGDNAGKLGDYAWYSENSDGSTHPVARKKPNAWGLYDMHGNAREWCYDRYAAWLRPSRDPIGPSGIALRVVRGGSWDDGPQRCRSAHRDWDTSRVGFRVVLALNGALHADPLPSDHPRELKLDLGQGVFMEFVLIPAGEFDMGSPVLEAGRDEDEDFHRVRITKPFYMAKYETTQAQWLLVMGENQSDFRNMRNPVEQVSWDDSQQLLERLRQLLPGRSFRLPTEAEWEYACRAGSTGRFSFGDSALGNYAWYYRNSDATTHPVGQKQPNAWGLYDMHGNVSEWCADHYGEYQFPVGGVISDPTGPGWGSWVLRGGSWGSNPQDCRSASRDRGEPGLRNNRHGFRVVLDLN